MQNINRFLMLAADAAPSVEDAANQLQDASPYASIISALGTIVPFVLIIAVFYFLILRPQKKQEKEKQKMLNSIEIGDTVTTIGGITGIVRQIKDDEIYIGADKNRISIRKWAIQSKDTISE